MVDVTEVSGDITSEALLDFAKVYAEAVLVVQDLTEEVEAFQALYDVEHETWLQTNPRFASGLNAKSRLEVLLKSVDSHKEKLRDAMEGYFHATGDKYPVGHDAFTIQERTDWDYDDGELLKAVLLNIFSSVDSPDIEQSFLEQLVGVLVESNLVKVQLNKSALRALLKSVTHVGKTPEGGAVAELMEDFGWLPVQPYMKTVTVISDKKAPDFLSQE